MYRRKDYIGFHVICTALATAAVAFVAGLALFGIKSLLSLFTVTEASFFIGVIGGAISLCSTTHTELLMKLAYMDVAAVHAASLSFIAAVLFGIGDAYKSMH